MEIWQKRLGRWWNTKIKVNLTQVHEQMGVGHPVLAAGLGRAVSNILQHVFKHVMDMPVAKYHNSTE